MLSPRSVWQRSFRPILTVLWELLRDGLQFLNVAARSQTAVTAEVLFLRKQLAYYQDHQIRPRRLTDAARLSLVLWSQLFEWKEALIVVTPRTFVRWHRKAFKLHWRWKGSVASFRCRQDSRPRTLKVAGAWLLSYVKSIRCH
jgi:hypothetical protein